MVAAGLVIVSALVRVWPLQDLGLRLAYLTFYPSVMIAALYGGLSIGLLTTLFSVLVISFWSPTGQPFIVDTGDWLGMATFIVNCTMISIISEAMRHAKERARKLQEQAEAANQAKSVFLSTMSHELRTPLNAILGFSNMMYNVSDITQEQRENLAIIKRSGEHLLSLINDVLDMAKIESGRSTLEIKSFNLDAQVYDIVGMLGARAAEKGLNLRLDQPAACSPRFIKGDETKLRQIIVNLMSNAIKFTDHGSVILRLGIQPDKGGILRLIIEVEDTGIGISKGNQSRIFEPFIQIGKPATQKGTGLGLPIVRSYVELMGGSIRVESTLDKGSLFRVDLPVQRVEESEVVVPEVEQGRVIRLEPDQPEYRILIVEDQLENWLLLQRLLENAGFTVKLANDGAKGVELFQSFHPHLICMDKRMPVMDGLEATRRIRALDNGKEVKIVAISASALIEQRDEMLAVGMDDFVRKPYRADEIFDCIAKHLGVRYMRKQSSPTEAESILSFEALAKLPEVLRLELKDGLVLGHVERLANLAMLVEKQDAELAKVLTHHLNNFNYLPILKALDIAQTHFKGSIL